MSWLTSPLQRAGHELSINVGTGSANENVFLLTTADNDFVTSHPRFAKRNDIQPVRRIVGDIRVGLYSTADIASQKQIFDYQVDYGIVILKGDYDDDGTWNPPEGVALVPSPQQTSDEDDKWLFKNTCFLSFGLTIARLVGLRLEAGPVLNITNEGVAPVEMAVATGAMADSAGWFSQPLRPAMMSTDQQLPNGSHIDLKTRRVLKFGEKLAIVASVTTEATDTETTVIDLTHNLRILISG